MTAPNSFLLQLHSWSDDEELAEPAETVRRDDSPPLPPLVEVKQLADERKILKRSQDYGRQQRARAGKPGPAERYRRRVAS